MLKHKGSVILATERLLLRPFRESDAEPMFLGWASDPEVAQYMTWPAHKSVEETKELLHGWIAESRKKDYYHWIIELERHPVGTVGVGNMNVQYENCEIGYCISKRFWSQGIATEAVDAVIHFLMDEVGFHRVSAKHDIANIGSGRVMQKCGMHFEAIEREAVKRKDGSFGNLSVYAIIAEQD